MMGSPRPVLQQASPQRLFFPVAGDFGYDEPVGRKKLLPKQSAIHRIIFNHDIEQSQAASQDFQCHRRFN
jgi:hypothetical protein